MRVRVDRHAHMNSASEGECVRTQSHVRAGVYARTFTACTCQYVRYGMCARMIVACGVFLCTRAVTACVDTRVLT